ncbi:MAG: hypothetical protein VKK59_05750, partial [Vampirovibrionales bacterium]|nr:hypothetical protein [Vampirovibrionales bacterium]
ARRTISMKHSKTAPIITTLAGFLLCALWRPAFSAAMERYDGHMAMVMQNTVSTASASEDAPFEAKLQEPVCVKAVCLPAGTLFQGRVTNVKAGKELSLHAPSIAVHIDQVRFANGMTVPLHYEPNQSNKIYTREQLEKKQVNNQYRVVKVVGTGLAFVSLPAAIATKAAGGALVGVQNEGGSKADAVVKGVYKATPIPDAINFIQGQDDITYTKGQTIYLQLPEAAAQSVFEQYQASTKPQSSKHP